MCKDIHDCKHILEMCLLLEHGRKPKRIYLHNPYFKSEWVTNIMCKCTAYELHNKEGGGLLDPVNALLQTNTSKNDIAVNSSLFGACTAKLQH